MGNKKNLTPQEKKLLSYAKDTRNTYGESRSRSRFAIAKRKAYGHQSLRHEQKLILKEMVKAVNDERENIEAKMKSVEPKRWRKYPDSSLGEFVNKLLHRRTKAGINSDLKSSELLSKAERKSSIKWNTIRWKLIKNTIRWKLIK